MNSTKFYTWRQYSCAYQIHQAQNQFSDGIPLLLVHPIGVGLSRQFWRRFCGQWYIAGHKNTIYNPDLLGCGESDMPAIPHTPKDWAEQLYYLLHTVIQTPVVVVVQGALLPVVLELVALEKQSQPSSSLINSSLIRGLILAGPPSGPVITKTPLLWRQKLAWNIFNSPFGAAFYRYARREKFLRSFSVRQLFASEQSVDQEWLEMLSDGAKNPGSRHAVFSFLAGFWRQDYRSKITAIQQPTLVVMGETASSISKEGKRETPDERLADYLVSLPNGQGVKLPGRNVLPYESTTEFVEAIAPFLKVCEDQYQALHTNELN